MREALDALLRRYIPALRVHLTMDRLVAPDEVDDLIQGFISDKIIERNLVGLADRSRGKFRTLLLKALDSYCIDQHRAARALKRAPAEDAHSLDDRAFAIAGPDERAARDAAFDAEWARQLLSGAVDRMKAECAGPEKTTMWVLFEERILRPAFEGAAPMEYEALVDRLRLQSPSQAANMLVTAKRMLVRHLRAAIAEYAMDEAEVEQELSDLRQVLSSIGR